MLERVNGREAAPPAARLRARFRGEVVGVVLVVEGSAVSASCSICEASGGPWSNLRNIFLPRLWNVSTRSAGWD